MSRAMAPPVMGMRGEDVEFWFDVYAQRRPVPHELGIHDDFVRCLVDSGGSAGVWRIRDDWTVLSVGRRCPATLVVTVGGCEYIYRPNGFVTAGGFTFYSWPD